MTYQRNPNAETAAQYLVWALGEIKKTGNEKAAEHARMALKALGVSIPPVDTTD